MGAKLKLGRWYRREARTSSSPSRGGSAAIGGFTAGAVAITVGVTAAGAGATLGASDADAVLAALARGVIVGLPLAVALYACRRPAHARFGRQLLLVSGLWFVASLSTSSSPLLYSVGRVAGWLAETGLVYTLLVFPGGKLRGRFDQGVMAVSVVAVITLYLPTALLAHRYPAPSPWSNCYLRCPHNAFMALASQPAWIDGLVNPLRNAITIVVFLIVAGRLAQRIRGANALMRRTVTPVAVVAIARLLVFVAGVVSRGAAPASGVTEVIVWVIAFAMPAIALAFLLGLVRWHLFVAEGIRKVNARLRDMPGPEQVRDLLATTFEDPQLQIGSWSSRRRRWIDAAGVPLPEPAAGSGRWLTEVRDQDRRVVAIVHDAALREDSAYLEAAAAAAAVAFASERVATRTATMVRELRASRARILTAADDERRRIERDLHDGAQQRLVALCIHLELAAERTEPERPDEAAALRGLADEVEQALADIRTLSHGVYPAMLADRGLAEAVRSAALRAPVPTSVEVHGVEQYPPEISSAVYFCCLEALQNIAKHAHGAQSAHILLREAGSVLYFTVSDDGPGLTRSGARVGTGMLNMHDRMKTVGGQLTVQSRPGEGAEVSGRIPLAAVTRVGAMPGNGHASRDAHTIRRGDHRVR